MPSKEQILTWLDRAIAVLDNFSDIIPGKIDDLASSFLKWARSDETFLGWLEKFEPAAANAITAPPEELVDALRRWQRETDPAAVSEPGQWMELFQLIMQIAAWIQKRRKTAPA